MYAPRRTGTLGTRRNDESRHIAGQMLRFLRACLTAPTGTTVKAAAYVVSKRPADAMQRLFRAASQFTRFTYNLAWSADEMREL